MMQSTVRGGGIRRTWSSSRAALLAVLGMGVLAAACGSTSSAPPYQPPGGWHDSTAPTSQAIAAYAVSPDVPGLIVACIGDKTAKTSAALFGQAGLWRTRDGGTSWRLLTYSALDAGCQMTMPPGGNGTIFAASFFGTSQQQELIVASTDAGDTWEEVATNQSAVQNGHELPGNGYRPEALQVLYGLLTRSVYRDGQTYAVGQVAITSTGDLTTPLFSASANHGLTWTAIESAPDPLLQQGFVPQAIAADYRASNAWYRLLGRSQASFTQQVQGSSAPADASAASAMLEHSADGGRTWAVLGPVGPRGPLAYVGWGATLATIPGQPARVCAAFAATVMQSGQATIGGPSAGHVALPGAVKLGVPFMPPTLTALAGSDDGGRTWTGGTVVQHSHNGGAAAGPGVVMDTRGDCYVGDNASQSAATPTATPAGASPPPPAGQATFWRLAPGAGATPQNIAQLAGLNLLAFGVTTTSASDATPRLVALVNTPQQVIVCQANVCPPTNSTPPRLIWMAAP